MVSRPVMTMSDYVGDDFVGKVPNLVNISIEAVIAEIVDNSLDKSSDRIHVELEGTNMSSFSVIVYDNSPIGFGSENGLDAAFRLAGEKSRNADEIGTFNMGMQISTLSRFNSVAAFTKIGSEIFHRRVSQQHNNEEKYEPLIEINYPSASKVKKKIKNEDWTSAIVLSEPRGTLFGNSEQISAKELEGFSRQVAMFFGITYEAILRKNNSLCLTVNQQKVAPIDPFWTGFTPSNLQKWLDAPSSDKRYISDPKSRNALACAIPWGTIQTSRVTLDVPHNGKEHQISVQGFVIPYGKVRKKLYDQDLTDAVFYDKPKNAGTDTLNSQHMSGFFFYRNGRCIAFGRTGTKSNGGWYDYGMPGGFLHLGVRFKIEFHKGLDTFMQLSPTKSEVFPGPELFTIIQKAWDQKINDSLLRNKLGNGKRSFYSNEETSKSVVGAAISPSNQSQAFVDDCDICEGFHIKGVPCHFAPCSICNRTNCEAKSCNYECLYCKVVGHHVKENCSMNCQDCELEGGHELEELCPARCEDCQELKSDCDCPCLECGKPQRSECQCIQICEDCGQLENNCECGQGESFCTQVPEESVVTLELFKKNKLENIKYLRETIEFLGIKKEEL
jgi:hypothetical protein